MSTAYIISDLVDRLTIDIWAKIFSHLPRLVFARIKATEDQDEGTQATTFRLRLVCKKFNQAFAHPYSGQTKSLLPQRPATRGLAITASLGPQKP